MLFVIQCLEKCDGFRTKKDRFMPLGKILECFRSIYFEITSLYQKPNPITELDPARLRPCKFLI